MEKKNVIFLSVIAVATLLTAVVGTTFAYFTATVSGNQSANNVTVSTDTLAVTYAQTSSISVANWVPGKSASMRFTVANGSNNDTKFNLVWNTGVTNTIASAADAKDITYTLYSCTGAEDATCTTELVTAAQLPAANAASTTAIPEAANLTVKANGTNYYKLTVNFAETNKEQNSLQGKSFAGTIIVGAAGTALR
ncbi:MAG: TasA family protein [Bacilli bacterium]|nr:TasA family protein [Bacilli bacterium]